jgi:anti-anti-sigma regulatory factor
MTCRIERVVIGEVILRISGQVTRQEVDLLQALLERETKAPILDLKDVLLVDREAIKLLAARELNGVELRNCSAYIREWITKERLDGSALGQMTEDSKQTGDF